MFKRIEGDTVILVQSGVYKVADLYERESKLFAAIGGGYVRLYASGTTSKDKLHIDALMLDGPLYKDRLGRLCTNHGKDRVLIDDTSRLSLEKD